MVKIGLECHVQLDTDSKFFCSCPVKEARPNSNCCPVCLGMPGARPQVNRKVIRYGIRISLALNCQFPRKSHFSRKAYFYPDVVKNFQITQYSVPLAKRGFLKLKNKKIRIRRVHLEEDPGKLKHAGGSIEKANYVLVDYNRSGVPLCEVVTEPDLESPEEAKRFLRKLTSILEFLGVYDPVKGNIRCDANVSIEGGTRVEVKNILGVREAAKAISYEISRHKNMKRRGKEAKRETRHWDESAGVTRSLRKKELEKDYGYIFEPDLSVITLGKEKITKIQKEMPKLPSGKIRELQEKGIGKEAAEVVVNRGKPLTDFLERCLEFYENKVIGNFTAYRLLKVMNNEDLTIKETKIKPREYVKVIEKLDKNEINKRQAEEILRNYVKKDKKPSKLLEKDEYEQWEITENLINKVIRENGDAVEDYKNGREEALDFLVGEIIKKTKGKADPKKARKKLKERLTS